MLRQYFLAGLIVFFSPTLLLGQLISDFSYKLVNSKIEVKYTLEGDPADRFSVVLYSSLDDYSAPLQLVSGDTGNDVIPGEGKKIIWDAKQELGEFKGGIALKLKALFVPFITFSKMDDQKVIMGKTNEVSWEGEAQNLKLELYQNNRKIADIATVRTGHHYDWEITKKAFAKGSNYKIKGLANGREVFSGDFALKNKMPVYMYLIPVAVIGGVIIVLQMGKSAPEDNPIPPPIGPN